MKTFIKTFLIVFVLVYSIGYVFSGSDNTSTSTSTNSNYSQCMYSLETQFMVRQYKQKYPQLSNDMIAHILCTKK